MQPPETATTVRVQDGKTLTTDGPFVEIKEAIGGYFFLEADDLDAAIDVASRFRRRTWAARSKCVIDGVVATLEQAFREQRGRVLAALIGFLGDFDLAEEAVQDASHRRRALARDGIPENPGGWLVATLATGPSTTSAVIARWPRRRACSKRPRPWRTV